MGFAHHLEIHPPQACLPKLRPELPAPDVVLPDGCIKLLRRKHPRIRSLDREEAERREVSQARFTSLDRVLARAKPADAKPGSRFEVSRRPDAPELSESGRAREQRLVARLNYLADAGLAQPTAPLTWSVDADFERTLHAFRRAQDRQRMMAQNAAFLSDPRLQYRVVSPHAGTDIVGRVIAHVLDEISDRLTS